MSGNERQRHAVPASRRRGSAAVRRAAAIAAAALAVSAVAARARAAAPGVTPNEVWFGSAVALSGEGRDAGQATKAGLEAAFLAVNEAGGVNGRILKLLTVDHGDDPARAQAEVKGLVEPRRVLGFVGSSGSAAVEATYNYLMDKQVVLFASPSGASSLRGEPPDRYVFNFRPSWIEEASAATRHLMTTRKLGPGELAFFGLDDAYGEAGWKGFAAQVRRLDGDPAVALRVQLRAGAIDIGDAAQRIQASADTRAVVCFAPRRLVVKLVEALQGSGLVFVAGSGAEPRALAQDLSALGPQFMRDVLLTEVVPSPTARAGAVARYQDQLKKYFPGEKPGFASLQAWLSAQVLVEAVRRSGKDLDAEKLVEKLEGIQGLDVGAGTPVSFGPSEHQALHRVWGYELTPAGAWSPIAGFE